MAAPDLVLNDDNISDYSRSRAEQDDFCDEVLGILKKAHSDHVAFQTVETDLITTRRAYSQPLAYLTTAVKAALIELPVARQQQGDVSSVMYARGLNEVITKFRRVLQSLHGADQLNPTAVADALIKVLRGSRQLTTEWKDAYMHNTIISPLTHGNIINNNQVPDIITLVSDATHSPDYTLLPDKAFELLKLDRLSRGEEHELHMEISEKIWSPPIWDVMSVMLEKSSLTETEVSILMKLWDEALA